MKRENKINRLKEKAKNTFCAMVGVNIRNLKLTNQKKHELIKKGYHLANARDNQLILTYSQESRAKDLREKVNKGRSI